MALAEAEAAVEEAKRWAAASLAVAERQAVVTASREESLRAHEAAAVEFLSSLQAHVGDVARRDEQVTI